MSALLQAPVSSDLEPDGAASDHTLVAHVRRGDERAFEALYERYHRRIHSYVFGMVKDHQRAEDVTQEVFVSSLRRMRATERPIAFKPWIYEIAKNACIDQFRRSKRAEEVSIDADDGLAPSDYGRLVSPEPVPDAALVAKQQLDDLCGAFGGLSDAHHKILVLRELEGLSYKQIGEKMGMSRPAVESTLFRARRRLSEEYDELASGQRCQRIQSIIADASGGRLGARDTRRLARHVAHCQPCRREAIAAGVVDSAQVARTPARRRAIEKVAALFPMPLLLRGRRGSSSNESWVNQLPLMSEHAAAGGAKLAAIAALVVAGIGAGVGTQAVSGARDDRSGASPAKATERAAPQPAGASGRGALTPAVTDSSSADDRSRGAARRDGTSSRPGSDAQRKTAAADGRSDGGQSPAAAPTDAARERVGSVPDAVRGAAPDTDLAPSAGDPTRSLDVPLPSLPSPNQPRSVDPVGTIGNPVGAAAPQVQGAIEQLGEAGSGATAPVLETVEGAAGALPTGG